MPVSFLSIIDRDDSKWFLPAQALAPAASLKAKKQMPERGIVPVENTFSSNSLR